MPQSGFEEGFTVATSGSLDEWVKEIHAKVPGVIEGYIYDQLKLVIKDFFQRTKSWRAYLGPFIAPANDGVVCMNPVDAHSTVIQILSVFRNGAQLTHIDEKTVPVTSRTETNSRNPSRYYLSPYDTIILNPTPAEDVEDLYVVAALTPRLRADNVLPQWIIDQHYEAIKAGLLSRLYEEPGKIYTNTVSAELWGKRYRAELVRSRSVGIKNYGEQSGPWSYNQWVM
jgi:hypothetical protein